MFFCMAVPSNQHQEWPEAGFVLANDLKGGCFAANSKPQQMKQYIFQTYHNYQRSILILTVGFLDMFGIDGVETNINGIRSESLS